MSKCTRPKSHSRCGGRTKLPKNSDLAELVDFYLQKYGGFEKSFIGLSTTIDYVCGKDNRDHKPGEKYKKNWHQRRLTNETIECMAQKLDALNLEEREIRDFESLIELVRKPSIKFFKHTNSYDFAFRYGLNHEILPEKYVYIHSGAKQGAEVLRNAGFVEFSSNENRIPIESFPLELRKLSAYDLENFLCVMKKQLEYLKPNGK